MQEGNSNHQEEDPREEEEEEQDLFEGITKEEIDMLVEEGENLGSLDLTEPGLLALLKSIEVLFEENAELRAAYPTEPNM